MSYYITVLSKNYANFKGRARRKEYWMFYLMNTIVAVILGVVTLAIPQVSLIGGIYSLAILLPSFAVSVRRLHDIDKSGWWMLISFIPIIGAIWLLILICKDGTPGTNEYGVNPKELGGNVY